MDRRIEAYQQRLIDTTIDANYQLWAALLATEGTLVSLFSFAGIALDQGFAVSAVALLGIIAMVCVVLNFKSTRDLYRDLGSQGLSALGAKSSEEMEADEKGAAGRKKWRELREALIYAILILQAALLVWMLLFPGTPSP